ncbi:hypothetical protein [Taibaiella chishuiensis]|uniref:DUF7919 domain-containing protein n=1 Tax=Taibaiella chishuiensis TaxID=1434707 RepID=A0A2P8D7B3_9BACT|nr:hypothetical protein [Taibaiella chishuiensis]PSK93126.1 hypothetical protein B0I18_10295 [Taibaiella chishuiensis]
MIKKQEDLSKYSNTELNIYNIGWLDATSSFASHNTSNNSSNDIVEQLTYILKRERVNLTRGIDTCPLCPEKNRKIYLNRDDKEHLLGISELWIPNDDETKVFAAPDLIIHYINDHGYVPPRVFVDCVFNFDLNTNWSGANMYERFIAEKYRQ